MSLSEIWPEGFYCGPSAIAAVTGKTCVEARIAINLARGARPNRGIIGLSSTDMMLALRSMGVLLGNHVISSRVVTLQELAESLEGSANYVVNVTGHYVALCRGVVADNRIRFGCPVSEHPCRRKHVRRYFAVMPPL